MGNRYMIIVDIEHRRLMGIPMTVLLVRCRNDSDSYGSLDLETYDPNYQLFLSESTLRKSDIYSHGPRHSVYCPSSVQCRMAPLLLTATFWVVCKQCV